MSRVLLIISFLFSLQTWAGIDLQKKADSLKDVLKQPQVDTQKVITLNELSWAYRKKGVMDSSFFLATEALRIAIRCMYLKGISTASNNRGLYYAYTGNFNEALRNYSFSLRARELMNDKKGVAYAYGNMGNVYHNMGNYPEALKKHFMCLRYLEKAGDEDGAAKAHQNIGNIYYRQGNYTEALNCYNKSIELFKKNGNRGGIADLTGNIGECYRGLRDFNKALMYQRKALVLQGEDPDAVSNIYSDIGLIYLETGVLDSVMINYEKALAIRQKTGDVQGIAWIYGGMGEVLLKQGRLKEAEEISLKGLKMSEEIGDPDNTRQTLMDLSDLCEAQGRYSEALSYYKRFVIVRDSMINEENTRKTVRQQMQYEFDKKEEKTQAEQEKKEAIADAEKRKQRFVLMLVSGFLFLVAAFAVFAWRSFLQKKKATNEISKQKELIEEKQKEILDSIYYARRIQRSLLTGEKYIHKKLLQLIKNN